MDRAPRLAMAGPLLGQPAGEILHISTSFGPGPLGMLVISLVNFMMVVRITELESEVPVLFY